MNHLGHHYTNTRSIIQDESVVFSGLRDGYGTTSFSAAQVLKLSYWDDEEDVEVESEAPEEGQASITVSNSEVIYGDNIQIPISYVKSNGSNYTDNVDLTDVDITDENENQVEAGTRLDAGTYQISVKPEVLDRFGLDPAETNIEAGQLTVEPKVLMLHIPGTIITEGSSLLVEMDGDGFVGDDGEVIHIVAEATDGTAVSELSSGRHLVDLKFDGDEDIYQNYLLSILSVEITVLPRSDTDWIKIGGSKTYDGTTQLPEDFMVINELIDGLVSVDDLEYLEINDAEWTATPPVDVGSYSVKLSDDAATRVRKFLLDEYDTDYNGIFTGSYTINHKLITRDPENSGDLYLRLPTGKQFDGTSKPSTPVEHNLDLGYEINEEQLQFIKKYDLGLIPGSRMIGKADYGWQDGLPTEVGEYRIALKSNVVGDIHDTHSNYLLDYAAQNVEYTITPADNTDGSSNESTGSNSGGATTALTPDSIAYVGQTSGHTLPLATSNSQSDGMLPSTGQRNQTLLSMLGMTLLGTLGLAGWYKRQQVK